MRELPWFTAEELAAMTWTTPAYVRNLASKKQWRRRREGKRTVYAYEDAGPDLHTHSEERRKKLIAERHKAEKEASEAEYQRYYGTDTQVNEGA